jgi:hypothetical protein
MGYRMRDDFTAGDLVTAGRTGLYWTSTAGMTATGRYGGEGYQAWMGIGLLTEVWNKPQAQGVRCVTVM